MHINFEVDANNNLYCKMLTIFLRIIFSKLQYA
jgi:hypothetical protein